MDKIKGFAMDRKLPPTMTRRIKSHFMVRLLAA
jgi:hypothetical protein